jgi:hypothetical protein
MKASVETAQIVGSEGKADRKMQFEISGLIKEPGLNVFQNVSVGDMASFENDIIDVTASSKQLITDAIESE